MEKIKEVKWLPVLVALFMAVIAAGLCEIINNREYYALPENQRGQYTLSPEDVVSNGQLTVESDGSIDIDSNNLSEPGICYIQLNKPYNIIDLIVKPSVGTDFGYLSVSTKESKLYYYNPAKSEYVLNYHGEGDTTKIYLLKVKDTVGGQTIQGDNGIFKIQSLTVDNTFEFNANRFVLIFSLVFLGLILFFYWKYWNNHVHLIFLIMAICFGLNLVFMIPTYFSYDEKQHFVRAYDIASGDFFSGKDTAIGWPDNVNQFMMFDGKTSPFDSYDEKTTYLQTFSSSQLDNFQKIETTAATYLPVAYLPAALGILIGKCLHLPFYGLFYIGRAFNVIFYALIVSLALWKLRYGKRLMFLLGLLPSITYVVASYSADPMTIAFSFAAMTGYINMLVSPDGSVGWKHLLIFTLSCILLCMCKITYAPFILLLLTLKSSKMAPGLGSGGGRKERLKGWFVRFGACLIVGMAVLISYRYSNTHGLVNWINPAVIPSEQIRFIVGHPLVYLKLVIRFISANLFGDLSDMVGGIGYAAPLSGVIVCAVLLAVLLMAIVDNEVDVYILTWKQKISILLMVLLSALLVITALYVTYNGVGTNSILGVQARYFIPLAFPFLLLFRTPRVHSDYTIMEKNRFIVIFSFAILCMLASILLSQYLV